MVYETIHFVRLLLGIMWTTWLSLEKKLLKELLLVESLRLLILNEALGLLRHLLVLQ